MSAFQVNCTEASVIASCGLVSVKVKRLPLTTSEPAESWSQPGTAVDVAVGVNVSVGVKVIVGVFVIVGVAVALGNNVIVGVT